MIAFGHTAFGAGIGLAAYQVVGQSNPVAGLAAAASAGFIAHFIEDFIPHGHFFPLKDYKKKIIYVIVFDLFLSIAIFSAKAFADFGLSLKFLYIMAGIFGSQLPDVSGGLTNIGLFKPAGIFKLEGKMHDIVHWHGTGSKALLLGTRDIWQAAAVLVALFFI